MKSAILERTLATDRIKGVLIFGDQHIPTLERLDKHAPVGIYRCQWSHMATHNVDHYILLDVPGHTGIFIHIATLPEQLQGCIGSDRVSIGALETWGGKEDFWLAIKEAS